AEDCIRDATVTGVQTCALPILAFGLTWAIEFAVLILPGIRLDQNPPPWTRAVLAGVMWMPAISAFIVRRWITREGFASAGLRLRSEERRVGQGGWCREGGLTDR